MEFICVAFFWALFFGAVGWIIGSHKNRAAEGFLGGALLGPLGILIIALMPVYYARKCPECRLGIPKLSSFRFVLKGVR